MARLKIIPALVISTDATNERILRMIVAGRRGLHDQAVLAGNLREELERVLGAEMPEQQLDSHRSALASRAGSFPAPLSRVTAEVLETMFFDRGRAGALRARLDSARGLVRPDSLRRIALRRNAAGCLGRGHAVDRARFSGNGPGRSRPNAQRGQVMLRSWPTFCAGRC